VAVVRFHLAEINVARARAPLDDPLLADFVAQLDGVNRLAERTPGFVWRLVGEGGAASSYVRAFEDERMLVNLTVWESLESLTAYTYRSDHGRVYRDRARWFEPSVGPSLALWWIPAGHVPTVEEGKAKLDALAARGPTPEAFTFKRPFPAPGAVVETPARGSGAMPHV
jgi:Domain of unknown function (DUF3291)